MIQSNSAYGHLTQSKDESNAHYSVQGETAASSKVKDGHVTEDASKKTVSFLSM